MTTRTPPPDGPRAGTGTARDLGDPAGRADERDSGGTAATGASGDFVMDADWPVFHPDPSVPVFRPPAGAVDAHCHVFGPGATFPYAPERGYTPCDAPIARLEALHERLGLERAVLVQPGCHDTDHRALLDALAGLGERGRGVAVLPPDAADAELERLHAGGVRAARVDFVEPVPGTDPRRTLDALAPRLAERGWHIEIDVRLDDLEGLAPALAALPCPVVVTHLGRPNVTAPVDGPAFSRLLALVADHEHAWCKASGAERLSLRGAPGYEDVVPFARAMIERCPERTLWGSGWPHPGANEVGMFDAAPDDGHLVDLIPRIARSPIAQRRLLVDNPARLYWGS